MAGMYSDWTTPNTPRRTAGRLRLAAGALLLAAVGVGLGMAVYGCHVSLQAEQTLHDTRLTVRLVDAFVSRAGRWPSSWEELEALPLPADLEGDGWPAVSARVRGRVAIDFRADPDEVARRDPKAFTAIRSIGPHFALEDTGGCVSKLQETIRRVVGPKRDP